MKKITKLVMVILLCSIALISCKKDYNCNCSVTVDIPLFGTITSDTTITIEKVKKKDAKSRCNTYGNELNSEAQMFNGSASCSLD